VRFSPLIVISPLKVPIVGNALKTVNSSSPSTCEAFARASVQQRFTLLPFAASIDNSLLNTFTIGAEQVKEQSMAKKENPERRVAGKIVCASRRLLFDSVKIQTYF